MKHLCVESINRISLVDKTSTCLTCGKVTTSYKKIHELKRKSMVEMIISSVRQEHSKESVNNLLKEVFYKLALRLEPKLNRLKMSELEKVHYFWTNYGTNEFNKVDMTEYLDGREIFERLF